MRKSNVTPRRFIKSRSIRLPQPAEPEPDSSLDAGQKPAHRGKATSPKKAKAPAKPKPAWWFNVTYRGQVYAGGKDDIREQFQGAKAGDLGRLDKFLADCKAGDSLKIGPRLVECKLSPEAEPAFERDQTEFERSWSQVPSVPTETLDRLPTAEMCLTDRLRGGNFQQLLAQRQAEIDLDTFQAHGRTPTPEQRAALDAALEGPAVLVLEAGAGTGKTSSFQMLAQVLPGNGQYCSFGKAQTDDAKPKFAGTKVAVNTTHSLAFRAVGHQFADRLGGKRVRAEEVAKMLGLGEFKLTVEVQQKDGTKVPSERALAPGFLAGQVMGAVRRWCQGADREVTVEHFKYIDGIDLPEASGKRTYANNRAVAEYLVPYARKAWTDLSDPKGQLPYWPDCYVKLWQLSNPVIAADYILCDEAQDSAEVWLDIMRQQLGPSRKSRPMLVLCGDSAQQIYAWRGAVNAMASFPDAPRLFLSQSFRFGEAIAQAANAVLETLEDGTPLRLKGLPSIPSKLGPLADPDCVLCRTNAAAVASLLGGIEAGKRPHLVGGGADVLAFCEAVLDLQAGRPTNHPDLGCFGSWGEVERYVEEDEGEDLRLWVKLVNGFGAQKIHDAVKHMPKEADADFVVCTAHKSKGREWDTVKLASDFPTNDRAGDEERRLLYVAVTRAKLVLDAGECPFFTGEDGVDLTAAIIAGDRDREHASQSVLPPTPAVPSVKTACGWSWAKGRDGSWLLRGPRGVKPGTRVKVERRDGSVSSATVGAVEQDWPDACLYRKG